MITTEKIFCEREVLAGIERARTTGKPTLVSIVKKIANVDPVNFFAAGNKKAHGERFFWKAASAEDYLVGLGVCQLFNTNDSEKQFKYIEQEWYSIIKNSLVFNEFDCGGVGPLIFGGFSFDPLKEKTALWKNFAHTSFYLPKFLFSKIGEENYLTINFICTENDDEQLINKITSKLNSILSNLDTVKDFPDSKIIKEKEIDPLQWKASVTTAEQELRTSKSLKKVVLARELRLYFEEKVFVENVISELLSEQPDSYVFALEAENGDCFVGATPERLVKKSNEKIYTTCLAGSIGRGTTKEEDEQLGKILLNDRKNLIEHQYVVDMVKDAMEETCEEVNIPEKPVLLTIRDIQHLYTPVVAKSRKNTSLFNLVERLHPTPAIGGYPKMAAVEKIREIEQLDRGLYAGPIGWLDYKENGEFAVGLRSALVQGDEASLFAGCGVVVDSDADAEYEETSIKFLPMYTALGRKK